MNVDDVVWNVPEVWRPPIAELSRAARHDPGRAAELFEALAASPFARAMVMAELEALHSGRRDLPPRRHVHRSGWILHADATLVLSLTVPAGIDGAMVDGMPNDASMAVVSPGRIQIERYRATVPENERDVFNRAHRLAFVGMAEIFNGQALHLKGNVDVIRVAGCDGRPLVLTMTVLGAGGTLRWHYDTATGEPVSCSYADATASRINFLLAAIQAARRTDLAWFASRALEHAAHGVRWSAVRTLWALDPSAGAAATTRLLDDPHPHVRRAAAKTLRSLKPAPAEDLHAARPDL